MTSGTIRRLCWIAVLANPQPPALISIDEPELGIHPAWLPILATLIQQAAKRTLNKRTGPYNFGFFYYEDLKSIPIDPRPYTT